MQKFKKQAPVGIVILLSLLFTACFRVQVRKNVENPNRYFRKAYHQIKKIHRYYPDRKGKPHRVCALIYQESSREIVRISAPVWLASTCLDIGMAVAEEADEFDYEEQYDFDWSGIKDLSRIGPGLLLEVDDGRNKILIWMK